MSEAMIDRILNVKRKFDMTNDSDNIAPQDSVVVLTRLAKQYASQEGAQDGKFHPGREMNLSEMIRVARETFGYFSEYQNRDLDVHARHVKYNMARVSFIAEMALAAGTYTILQEKLNIAALKRLLDGHYDEHLKEDKIPLPFEWLKEYR